VDILRKVLSILEEK
jgi:hypothetical protein